MQSTALFTSTTIGGFDPTQITTVVFAVAFGMLGYGISNYSRVAAVLAFVFFGAVKAVQVATTGSVAGIGVGVIILIVLARAIAGTFRYHSRAKKDDPEYRRSMRRARVVWGVAALILFIPVSWGVLLTSVVATPVIAYGQDVESSHREQLVDEAIIHADASIWAFFTEGFLSVAESGVDLCEHELVVYGTSPDDGERWIRRIGPKELESLEVVRPGNAFQNCTVRVTWADTWAEFNIPWAGDQDQQFIDYVESWRSYGS